MLATTLPPFEAPVFLRLALPESDEVDEARQRYLLRAMPNLRACVAGWRDGAGVCVPRVPDDPRRLAAEVHEIGRGLRALANPRVAQTYLTLTAADPDDGAQPQGG